MPAQIYGEGPNPSGLCMCGCGEPAPIARQSDSTRGLVKGKPKKFVLGHSKRKSPQMYVVDPETGCWIWQRARTSKGYGNIKLSGGPNVVAHRWFYEQRHGHARLPISGRELARQYGLSSTAMQQLLARKTWVDVP